MGVTAGITKKSYEEVWKETLEQIPVYSKEWTDFNDSNPGITILQNLAAFHAIQSNEILQITDDIKEELMRLSGMIPAKCKAAKVLAEPKELPAARRLPQHKRLQAGGLIFETDSAMWISHGRLIGAYTKIRDTVSEITPFLERSFAMAVPVFGEEAKVGAELCLIFEKLPLQGQPLTFYVKAEEGQMRNPFDPNREVSFASILWQCYTWDGWTDMEAEDETHGFLVSGEIQVRIPPKAVLCQDFPILGYAIRAVLDWCRYDRTPKISWVSGGLIRLCQRDTKAAAFFFEQSKEIMIESELVKDGAIFVYGEEADGGFSLYEEHLYCIKRGLGGVVRIEFLAESPLHSYVVVYREEMLPYRALGMAYGYENETLDILRTEHILEDSVLLAFETRNEKGEIRYCFARPQERFQNLPRYQVLEDEGRIQILDYRLKKAGEVFLCACAVSEGGEGNIRAGNEIREMYPEDKKQKPMVLFNPAQGKGGADTEKISDLRRRFVADVKKTYTAVTAADYESIVRETPGLCIHKVKAVVDESRQMVQIVVKPYSEYSFAKLPELYKKQILSYLEPRRMLGVKIELVQPHYVAIDASGVIYVNRQYEDAKEQIWLLLEQELDFIHSEHRFGGSISFMDIYSKLEGLECVHYIQKLELYPQDMQVVTVIGNDIRLHENCLCYPGQIQIVLDAGEYH